MEELIVQEKPASKRPDVAISLFSPELTRTHTQKSTKEGDVLVDSKPRKASYSLTTGERLSATLPEPEVTKVFPESIPLDILYKDKDVIVTDKLRGMAVHPAARHTGGILINALPYYCRDSLSDINEVLRPRIVHRIDRDATGVMTACKSDRARQCIVEQLKVHGITRHYLVLTQGRMQKEEGTVDAPFRRDSGNRKCMKSGVIGGKHAVTHCRVLERFAATTYLECRLETGRIHQIRAHLASFGHPLFDDTVYGSGKSPYHLEGRCLHVAVLGLCHPANGHYFKFTAPLSAYFEALLDKFRQKAWIYLFPAKCYNRRAERPVFLAFLWEMPYGDKKNYHLGT